MLMEEFNITFGDFNSVQIKNNFCLFVPTVAFFFQYEKWSVGIAFFSLKLVSY